MAGKKRQTFGKMTRERARLEKREQKLEKKAGQKEAAAEARDAGLGGMVIGPPNPQGADDVVVTPPAVADETAA